MHASRVGFIFKLWLSLQFVITRRCFTAGYILFKVELFGAMLPSPFMNLFEAQLSCLNETLNGRN